MIRAAAATAVLVIGMWLLVVFMRPVDADYEDA